MKIFFYTGIAEKLGWQAVYQICSLLHERYGQFWVNPELYAFILAHDPAMQSVTPINSPEELVRVKADYCLSLGGDGTVLGSAAWVGASSTPVIGINLGRLGFLTGAEINELTHVILAMEQGNYVIEQRSVLQLVEPSQYFSDFPFALNDFTLLKRDTSSMIALQVELDGAFLNTYWADGFIVSTPTGSTGYNLSCGGPIVFPNSDCFVLTPVAPHHLNVRPIVVNDTAEICIRVEARTPNVLITMDSRHSDLPTGSEIHLKKGPFTIKLIQLQGRNFLKNMREKLQWGSDSRIKY